MRPNFKKINIPTKNTKINVNVDDLKSPISANMKFKFNILEKSGNETEIEKQIIEFLDKEGVIWTDPKEKKFDFFEKNKESFLTPEQKARRGSFSLGNSALIQKRRNSISSNFFPTPPNMLETLSGFSKNFSEVQNEKNVEKKKKKVKNVLLQDLENNNSEKDASSKEILD